MNFLKIVFLVITVSFFLSRCALLGFRNESDLVGVMQRPEWPIDSTADSVSKFAPMKK